MLHRFISNFNLYSKTVFTNNFNVFQQTLSLPLIIKILTNALNFIFSLFFYKFRTKSSIFVFLKILELIFL